MSTKELAKTIRAGLKEKYNLNSKKASVRMHQYSMGSSIYVNIKVLVENYDEIKDYVESFAKVRYCHHTQEILSGGNTFVTCEYDGDLRSEVSAQYLDVAKQINEHGNIYHLYDGIYAQRDKTNYHREYSIYFEDDAINDRHFHNIYSFAFGLGLLVHQRGKLQLKIKDGRLVA